jgi:hypothetical protein
LGSLRVARPRSNVLLLVHLTPLERKSTAYEMSQSTGRRGSTEAQGYLFSYPAPANELPTLIERLKRTGEYEPALYRGSDARSMQASTTAN